MQSILRTSSKRRLQAGELNKATVHFEESRKLHTSKRDLTRSIEIGNSDVDQNVFHTKNHQESDPATLMTREEMTENIALKIGKGHEYLDSHRTSHAITSFQYAIYLLKSLIKKNPQDDNIKNRTQAALLYELVASLFYNQLNNYDKAHHYYARSIKFFDLAGSNTNSVAYKRAMMGLKASRDVVKKQGADTDLEHKVNDYLQLVDLNNRMMKFSEAEKRLACAFDVASKIQSDAIRKTVCKNINHSMEKVGDAMFQNGNCIGALSMFITILQWIEKNSQYKHFRSWTSADDTYDEYTRLLRKAEECKINLQ